MRLPTHWSLSLLGGPLLLLTLLSLLCGAMPLTINDIWLTLWGQGDLTHQLVLWQIRLPRSLMAMAVGALTWFALGTMAFLLMELTGIAG